MKTIDKKIIVILVSVLFLLVGVFIYRQSKPTNQAAQEAVPSDFPRPSVFPPTVTPTETTAKLYFEPSSLNLKLNETKEIALKVKFINGTASNKIDYLKTEISYSNEFLNIPSGKYIDTSDSGLGKIIKVDGPVMANQKGAATIEIGAKNSGEGPVTQNPITLAIINFQAVAETPDRQSIGIDATEIVDNKSEIIPADASGLVIYTIGE